MLGELVGAAQVAGIAVPKQRLLALAPDQDPQRQLDANGSIALHEGCPTARVAEQHDLLLLQFHANIVSGRGMIDSSEHPEPAPLDRCEQRLHRVGIARHTPLDDHAGHYPLPHYARKRLFATGTARSDRALKRPDRAPPGMPAQPQAAGPNLRSSVPGPLVLNVRGDACAGSHRNPNDLGARDPQSLSGPVVAFEAFLALVAFEPFVALRATRTSRATRTT